MIKLLRLLTGVRDDLDLQSHWWHRVIKVCSLLFVVVLGGGSAFFVKSRRFATISIGRPARRSISARFVSSSLMTPPPTVPKPASATLNGCGISTPL